MSPASGSITPFLGRACPELAEGDDGKGVCRGAKPLCRGCGGVPRTGFITPFLARKGDGGMVETSVGHRAHSCTAGAWGQALTRPSSGNGKRVRAGPRYAAWRAAASVSPMRMLIAPIGLSNDARIWGLLTMTCAPMGSSTGGLMSHTY